MRLYNLDKSSVVTAGRIQTLLWKARHVKYYQEAEPSVLSGLLMRFVSPLDIDIAAKNPVVEIFFNKG
nr:hypothetical protein [uncultured Halomonas sp.]